MGLKDKAKKLLGIKSDSDISKEEQQAAQDRLKKRIPASVSGKGLLGKKYSPEEIKRMQSER